MDDPNSLSAVCAKTNYVLTHLESNSTVCQTFNWRKLTYTGIVINQAGAISLSILVPTDLFLGF